MNAAKKRPRTGGRRPLDERMAAIEAFNAGPGDKSVTEHVEAIAKKYKVTPATIYLWVSSHKKGSLHDPDEVSGKATRTRYSDAFKAKAVAAYHARGSRSVREVAGDLGITPGRLWAWARGAPDSAQASAELPSAPLAKRSNGNGHSPQRITLEAEPTTVAQLLRANRTMKALLHSLIDEVF